MHHVQVNTVWKCNTIENPKIVPPDVDNVVVSLAQHLVDSLVPKMKDNFAGVCHTLGESTTYYMHMTSSTNDRLLLF